MKRVAAIAVALCLLLPLGRARPAAAAEPVLVPYEGGLVTKIIQGYNGGTHNGVDLYSLDIVLARGNTTGAAVLAPAAGRIDWSYDPGVRNGCLAILIGDGSGLGVMLCHAIWDRSFRTGEPIALGQRLGYVGAPGTVGNNGVAHIHLQLFRGGNGVRDPLPYTAAEGRLFESTSLPVLGTAFNQHGGVDVVSTNPGGGSANAPPAPPPVPPKSEPRPPAPAESKAAPKAAATSIPLETPPPIKESTLKPLTGTKAGAGRVKLDIPWKSQFDGSPYEKANSGVGTLAMVLAAHGIDYPVSGLRQRANQIVPPQTLVDGLGWDVIAKVAGQFGLTGHGLYREGKIYRWTAQDLREEIASGNPVIALVRYRDLPQNAATDSQSDHYILLTGMDGGDFIYSDPAPLPGTSGDGIRVAETELMKALEATRSTPSSALALAGPEPRLTDAQPAPQPAAPQKTAPQPVVPPTIAPQPAAEARPIVPVTPEPAPAGVEAPAAGPQTAYLALATFDPGRDYRTAMLLFPDSGRRSGSDLLSLRDPGLREVQGPNPLASEGPIGTAAADPGAAPAAGPGAEPEPEIAAPVSVALVLAGLLVVGITAMVETRLGRGRPVPSSSRRGRTMWWWRGRR